MEVDGFTRRVRQRVEESSCTWRILEAGGLQGVFPERDVRPRLVSESSPSVSCPRNADRKFCQNDPRWKQKFFFRFLELKMICSETHISMRKWSETLRVPMIFDSFGLTGAFVRSSSPKAIARRNRSKVSRSYASGARSTAWMRSDGRAGCTIDGVDAIGQRPSSAVRAKRSTARGEGVKRKGLTITGSRPRNKRCR